MSLEEKMEWSLELAEKYIDEYIDMGLFRHPEEAKPYLMDGFEHGYKLALKLAKQHANEAVEAQIEKDKDTFIEYNKRFNHRLTMSDKEFEGVIRNMPMITTGANR